MPNLIHLNSDNNEVTWNKKQYLLAAAGRIKWDVFRESGRDNGNPEEYILNIQPCQIRAGHKWTGLWHIDILLNSNLSQQYGECDTVFISSNQGLYEGGEVLFQALDPELHRRIPEIPQDVDFVLTGSMGGVHSRREEMAAILKERFSYTDYGKDKKPEEYIRNINHAKVQWIHTGLSSEKKGALAQRFFECLGIGPVLTNWTNDLPLTGLVENEDYMAYYSESDMLRKMSLLINDEKLRAKIAYNGRIKALIYHSYEQRLAAIYNVIQDFNSTF